MKKNKWIVFALMLMIILSVFMTACKDKDQPENTTDPQQEQTVDPGTNPGGNTDNPSVDPGTNPSTDPTVNPGTDPSTDPTVEPGDDEKIEPEPEFVEPPMTEALKHKAYQELLSDIFAGQNQMVNGIISLFDDEDDHFRLSSEDEAKRAVAIEQTTYYLLNAGISPARFAWLLNDLKPIYDLFSAETTEEIAPANGAEDPDSNTPQTSSENKSEEKEDKDNGVAVLSFLSSAKAPVDLLLEEGNLDIVCNSIGRFLKDLPSESLLKLIGANFEGMFCDNDDDYNPLTEEDYFALFGTDKEKVKELFSFDNSLEQQFVQKECVVRLVDTFMSSLKMIVKDCRTEAKDILTSASSGIDYFSNLKIELKRTSLVRYRKSSIVRIVPLIVEKALPDLTDVSIVNNIGKIVCAVADYYIASGFDADLQETIDYVRILVQADPENETDVTGLSSLIKVVGAVLTEIDAPTAKNILADALTIFNNFDSSENEAKGSSEETKSGMQLAMEAGSRILIRLCRLIRPTYVELDKTAKDRFSELVKPYLVLEAENVVVFDKTLKKMLDELGQKPLYEDLTEEELAELTATEEELADEYVFQADGAPYVSAILAKFMSAPEKEESSSSNEKEGRISVSHINNYCAVTKINTQDGKEFARALKECGFYAYVYDADDSTIATVNSSSWDDFFDSEKADPKWSYAIDTTKAGFTTMTLTYKVSEEKSYSAEIAFFIVAENNANVIISYYSDVTDTHYFAKNTDFSEIASNSVNSRRDCGAKIYDKDTLKDITSFYSLYTVSGSLDIEKVSAAVDLTTCGIRGALLSYEHPIFGNLYYRFLYRVYDPENIQPITVEISLPKTIEITEESVYVVTRIALDDGTCYSNLYTLSKEEDGKLKVTAPASAYFSLDKFSIEGFSFTDEACEQEVKITFYGYEFTCAVEFVEEKEDDDDGFHFSFPIGRPE